MTGRELPDAAVRVQPGRAAGALAAPGSKSVTNRLLVLAALAEGDSALRHPLDSDDTRAMRRLVAALGADVRDGEGAWHVRGTGGRLSAPGAPVDVLLSGTTMRFGAALATLADGPVELTGGPSLLRRPIAALTGALRDLGADVRDRDGHPPVRTGGGGLRGGPVRVDVGASSQFASAVLLVAPYAREADVELQVHGEAALSYVELTAEAMRDWGARVGGGDGRWLVARGGYTARDVEVDYDASAAAHLWTVAAASGGAVTVTNVAERTLQADAAFPRLLAAMGCGVQQDGSALTVTGPPRLRGLGEWDLGAMPDQLPSAAVLAAVADGETVLRNVAVVRGHETDRIAALAGELAKAGVDAEELPDGLRIRGGVPELAAPVRLDTHDDHRLAMAFAALAARVPGIVIEEPWCVRKTYPRFWADLARLGLRWEAAA
ncbi:MAG TPA: 3-phosphoshikimate 1-carboxyvinyltransferase [Egibacteraceae bacterium]|nr:3-phosphoshikimate 1-carboxyvinyltransferase [Egibacteraceae bacterium]